MAKLAEAKIANARVNRKSKRSKVSRLMKVESTEIKPQIGEG
jgi:hypothetical protein